MITHQQFNMEKLFDILLDHVHGNIDIWRRQCDLILDYMPPYPRPDTKPQKVVVGFPSLDGEGHLYLRHGNGVLMRYFWDCYGDDFGSPEAALLALLQAPIPPSLQKAEVWARHTMIERTK